MPPTATAASRAASTSAASVDGAKANDADVVDVAVDAASSVSPSSSSSSSSSTDIARVNNHRQRRGADDVLSSVPGASSSLLRSSSATSTPPLPPLPSALEDSIESLADLVWGGDEAQRREMARCSSPHPPSPTERLTPTKLQKFSADDRRRVYAHVAKYARANDRRAAFEFWSTVATLVAALAVARTSLAAEPAVWLAAFVLGGLSKLRMFMIFHDTAHHAFFSSITTNYWHALAAGTIVQTPVSYWSKGHNYHHKHSNNVDRHQYAQTSPWTVEQFRAKKPTYRRLYTAIYGGLSLFTWVPSFYFLIFHRFLSSWLELVATAAYWSLVFACGGWSLVAFDVCICNFAATFGVILFHTQHTFDGAYKRHADDWDYFENGMIGSSFLQVPWWLKHWTFGIEYHHIHHLNTRVPCYRIQQCHDDDAAGARLFKNVPHVWPESIVPSLSYSLYDSPTETFVSAYDYL